MQEFSGLQLLGLAPLNLLPLLLSAQQATQFLAGGCLAGMFAQYFAMRHHSQVSSKVV
jgi:hypothetical protein